MDDQGSENLSNVLMFGRVFIRKVKLRIFTMLMLRTLGLVLEIILNK